MTKRWIRTGKCRKCGECCKSVGWLGIANTPEVEKWLKARGLTYKASPHDGEVLVVSLPCPCPQLKEGADGTFKCALHGKNKPKMCVEGPEEPNEMTPRCGYKWQVEDS
jgi:Fe-S-cluster containining protein